MGEKQVCVGAIAGSFGVRGEVRLKSFCTDPQAIAEYGPLTTEDGKTAFDVKITRPIKGGYAARLTGITTKEEADGWRGTSLFAPRARLPHLSDDEYYHADLIGLEVFDPGGVSLGRVRAVHDHGAGDFLEVTGKGAELLIPFTMAAVPMVDIAAGRIVADPPDATDD
jgi:16S rRNA processing protein RimM